MKARFNCNIKSLAEITARGTFGKNNVVQTEILQWKFVRSLVRSFNIEKLIFIKRFTRFLFSLSSSLSSSFTFICTANKSTVSVANLIGFIHGLMDSHP